ncbi:MAG: hypothetical protein E6J20_08795 [Chloroflexi bacterium]|nr:MAG: hypothetical protein E6J20_08795 [Chloroflexota bacterium]
MAAGFLVLLALIEITFRRFPSSLVSSGTGPKANVAIWFGSDGAGLFYMGLGAVYAALYLWVSAQVRPSENAWRVGAMWGVVSGAVWMVVTAITDWIPDISVLRPLSLLVVLGSPVIAGVLAARAGESVRDRTLAGFWCGVVSAVLIAGSIVGLDNAFATTLEHSRWMHDPTCPQAAGSALAGCEIGDDLGFVDVELTLIPLVWAGLGAIGGAVSLAFADRAVSPRTRERADVSSGGVGASRKTAVRAPIIFGFMLLTLFVVEMILKLV